MSEHITHLAVSDDACRLAQYHPAAAPWFKEILTRFADDVRMGALTRSADQWTAELIVWARGQLAEPQERRDPRLERKIAFVLGALTHRAADRLMKPIIRCWPKSDSTPNKREATVYQDICSLREVFGGGQGPLAGPLPKAFLDSPQGPGAQGVEAYLQMLWRRSLIAMHTFSPDSGDMGAWLDRFFDCNEAFGIDLKLYARVAQEWDPAKVQLYLLDKKFYDRSDRLIELARQVQAGRAVEGAEVAAVTARTCDAHSSRYARAIAKALDYLQAASDLLEARITPEDAKARFDVGKPETFIQE